MYLPFCLFLLFIHFYRYHLRNAHKCESDGSESIVSVSTTHAASDQLLMGCLNAPTEKQQVVQDILSIKSSVCGTSNIAVDSLVEYDILVLLLRHLFVISLQKNPFILPLYLVTNIHYSKEEQNKRRYFPPFIYIYIFN
jgi:hypothetical protein